VFGVYTKNDIKNYLGKTVISSNKLVDLIEIDGNGSVTSKIDLPEGEYYVKELYVTYPYTLSSNKNEFTLKYNGDSSQEFVVTQGEQVVNSYVSGTITLIKLSSSTVDNIIMNGDQIDTTGLDEKVKEILETIKGKTEDEIKTYFEEKNVKFVAGAKYVVYTDEECKNQLRIKDEETGEFKVAELVTDELGFIKMDKVPTGHYYFKEVEAPEGSKIS
jgi:hypothetical protein